MEGIEEVHIELPYEPRPLQQEIHDNLKRFNVIVCHRRFGKTVLAINELIRCAIDCEHPNPRFAYIAPLFVQAKTVAWDYLKLFTAPIPGVTKNEAELRVDLPNGARISLYGAENPDRLRGIWLDGVVLDEYADMSPRMWSEVIRPALADRRGWALFIGTPKGRNQFYSIYNEACADPEWFARLYRASETKVVALDELEAARKVMTEEQYDQEFECSFQAALIGAYYGKEISKLEKEGHVTDVSYNPSIPVHTAWDLGIDDSTAIWFVQQSGPEYHIINYYENSGCGLDHYAKHLNSLGYHYGSHLLPHDAEVKELGTGQTRVETLASLGIKNVTVLPSARVEDGINAVRMMLPRCWFAKDKTAQGLEALRQYQRDWDDKMKVFRNNPRHDWASHGSDSFRYLAMGLNQLRNEDTWSKPLAYRQKVI